MRGDGHGARGEYVNGIIPWNDPNRSQLHRAVALQRCARPMPFICVGEERRTGLRLLLVMHYACNVYVALCYGQSLSRQRSGFETLRRLPSRFPRQARPVVTDSA